MSRGKLPVESTFPLWRRGIPRLGRSLNALRRLEKLIPSDDLPAQLAIIDTGLRVNREIRETLLAEMKVRREIVELRKLELDGCSEDEIETLLVRTATRRGYRHINGIRHGVLEFLTTSVGAETALRIVDRCLPPARIEAKRNRLSRTLGQQYDALERDLEEGAREIRDALQDDPQGLNGNTESEIVTTCHTETEESDGGTGEG